jgi:hypothetical protein
MSITYSGPEFVFSAGSDVQQPIGLGGAVVAWALPPYFDGKEMFGHALVIVSSSLPGELMKPRGFTQITLQGKGGVMGNQSEWETLGSLWPDLKYELSGTPGWQKGIHKYRTKRHTSPEPGNEEQVDEGYVIVGPYAPYSYYRTHIILASAPDDTGRASETGPELKFPDDFK